MLLNIEAVGGARGFYGIPGMNPIKFDFGETELIFSGFMLSFFHAAAWAGLTFLIIWRLVRSTHGRGFLSVRDDEVAAEAMGINTTQMKVRAFVLSSFFAGVAGSLFAHFANYLNPSTFSFLKSVDALIIVVLGGMGSLSGSVIAAIFITVLPEALRPLQDITGIDLRLVIYALALILLMLLRPTGMMGSKELPQLWRRHGKSA
jgi:branched-chain amino acid transport system permease protein